MLHPPSYNRCIANSMLSTSQPHFLFIIKDLVLATYTLSCATLCQAAVVLFVLGLLMFPYGFWLFVVWLFLSLQICFLTFLPFMCAILAVHGNYVWSYVFFHFVCICQFCTGTAHCVLLFGIWGTVQMILVFASCVLWSSSPFFLSSFCVFVGYPIVSIFTMISNCTLCPVPTTFSLDSYSRPCGYKYMLVESYFLVVCPISCYTCYILVSLLLQR